MSLLYDLVVYPLIFIFPAYVANAAPVLFGGGTPVDMYMKISGKRIFGDHKTMKGLVSGMMAGFLISIAESWMFPQFLLASGIAMTLGAHFGDLAGSFIKRRSGIEKGGSAPFLDQYLFVVFALIFSAPFGHMPSAYGIAFILVITGAMHVAMNRIAYRLKFKDVPW